MIEDKSVSFQRRLLLRSKALSRKHLYVPLRASIRSEAILGNRKILNIGSGGEVGRIINEAWNNADGNLVSVDISPEREPDVCTDACMLPFADDSFDLVICCEVLEHVREPSSASREIFRVLRPNGKLVLTAPFVYPIHERPHDYFRFTKFGLRMLFEGFSSVEVNGRLNWGETCSLLIYRLLYEYEPWIRVLALPIYCCAVMLEYVFGTLARFFDSDYITAGYTVIAIK